LRARVRAKSSPAKHVERARVVLLAGEGFSAEEIADRVGCSRPTVLMWRRRYVDQGLAGLDDQPRAGRPKRLPGIEERIVAKTLAPPPKRLGITHWSARILARELRVSHPFVVRVWNRWGLKPHRRETFKFSTDPELDAKLTDVVGLYLNPPDGAIVLCIDEKSQIQALERTQPILPLRPGLAERATHDYKRNGTASLFAALEIATGQVTHRTYERHRHQEFLSFLQYVAGEHPRKPLHVVLDNYGTHKHPDVVAWHDKHPRITLHFTPTGASWLNLVEVFFSIITKQAIRRGSFTSVKDLTLAIRRFIDGWNQRCQPFTWTKTADELRGHVKRQDRTAPSH
ncbi:MAG: IS630 family transposase, partial [Gammaproteobacteria bacterium]